jgi:hypothetical protein
MPQDHPWLSNPFDPATQKVLVVWFHQWEADITCVEALNQEPPDFDAYRAGLKRFSDDYLFPLAAALDLIPLAQEHCIKACWRCFETDAPGRRGRAAADLVVDHVRAILASAPHDTSKIPAHSRVAQFLADGICPTEQKAREAARHLRMSEINKQACALVKGILGSFFKYNLPGLLQHSCYPFTREMLIIEEQARHIRAVTPHHEQIIACLRTDIDALYNILTDFDRHIAQWRRALLDQMPKGNKRTRYAYLHDPEQRKRRIAEVAAYLGCDTAAQAEALYRAWVFGNTVQPPRLAQQDMIHQPAYAVQRQNHQRAFIPELRTLIITRLMSQYGFSQEHAERVFDGWVVNGLDGIMLRYCMVLGETPARTLTEQRIDATLDSKLEALLPTGRQNIAVLIGHLHAAIEETQVSIPLHRLLRDGVSSGQRKRFSRSMWFSWGNIQKRAQRHTRTYKGIAPPPREQEIVEEGENQDEEHIILFAPENALVEAFARRAGIEEPTARQLIRQLGWYGGMGMLLKPDWFSILDEQIIDYIHLIKQGRTRGTVDFGALQQQANILASGLGLPALSMQVIRGVFNGLPTTEKYNSGVGPVVDGLHKRYTRITFPRLNENWLVVPTELALPIVNEMGKHISDVCFVTLIIEQGAERAMGCWISTNPPGSAEVALALYDAIWHSWTVDWPIKGIPERLHIPSSFADHDLCDMHRAAQALMIEVDDTQATVWHGPRNRGNTDPAANAPDVVAQLRLQGPDIVRKHHESDRVTIAQARQSILEWLCSDEWFPHHSPVPVPDTWPLALPGWRCPAAGWLLPTTGMVRRVTGGIRDGDEFYPTSVFDGETVDMLVKRAFPVFYERMEPGLFVESSNNECLFFIENS